MINDFNLMGIHSVETHVQQSTPSESHDSYSYHIAAAGAAGKHVLWKKPWTITPHIMPSISYFARIQHRAGDTVLLTVSKAYVPPHDAAQAKQQLFKVLQHNTAQYRGQLWDTSIKTFTKFRTLRTKSTEWGIQCTRRSL